MTEYAQVNVVKDKPESATYYTYEGIGGYLVAIYVIVLIIIIKSQKKR